MHYSRERPTSQRAKAKARDSEENVTIVAKRAIPQRSAQKAKKEEAKRERETASKGKVKRSWGRGVWQVDGEDPQGDWKRDRPEEENPAGSFQSVGKVVKVNVIDELVKKTGA